LAIGVAQYKDPQIPSLPFAKKDAERVRDWFVNLDAEGQPFQGADFQANRLI
jgi:hypothetical protein